MAASDPHEVSLGLSSLTQPCPTKLGGFGEDGSSDVEEPAVDVGTCKTDRFVADDAEKILEGEKRTEGGEGGRGRANLEGLLDAPADEEASLEDLLYQTADDDEEGGDSLYLCMPSLTLTFFI
jgi:hypothetical protein